MNNFGSSLGFAEIDDNYKNIPKPLVNGGWYTGEKFQNNTGWSNIYVLPDSGNMTYNTLKSAKPPKNANTQYTNIRPGNNSFETQEVSLYNKEYKFTCSK